MADQESKNFQSDHKVGFIVMDYKGTLFGTLSGNTREVLHKFTVNLSRYDAGIMGEMMKGVKLSGKWHEYLVKHGEEMHLADVAIKERRDYLCKTAELATQFFINPATSQLNVSALILAGSSNFVAQLISGVEIFGVKIFGVKIDLDPRLKGKILKVVDVSCGGESGFDEAIGQSEEMLLMLNVKFVKVKRLLRTYLEGIGQGNGRYVYGLDDTLEALKGIEGSSVETVIVWENIGINHFRLKNSVTNEIVRKNLNKEQEVDPGNFKDPFTDAELVVMKKMTFIEFLNMECERIECTLEIVTNNSQEGSQFCRGLGGIGCILQPAD